MLVVSPSFLRYLSNTLFDRLPVLFETEADGVWQGHADNYCLVSAPGGAHGIIRNVKILSDDGEKLIGIIV